MAQIRCEAAQIFLLAQGEAARRSRHLRETEKATKVLAGLLALDNLVCMELSCNVELLHTERSAEHGNEKILHDIMYLSLSQKDSTFFVLWWLELPMSVQCAVQVLAVSDGTKQKGDF